MVEAVAVHTVGLGGDSQVRLAEERWPTGPGLLVGPRRQVPLSLLALQQPWVLERMAAQLESEQPGDWDGRFALRLRRLDGAAWRPASSASGIAWRRGRSLWKTCCPVRPWRGP